MIPLICKDSQFLNMKIAYRLRDYYFLAECPEWMMVDKHAQFHLDLPVKVSFADSVKTTWEPHNPWMDFRGKRKVGVHSYLSLLSFRFCCSCCRTSISISGSFPFRFIVAQIRPIFDFVSSFLQCHPVESEERSHLLVGQRGAAIVPGVVLLVCSSGDAIR